VAQITMKLFKLFSNKDKTVEPQAVGQSAEIQRSAEPESALPASLQTDAPVIEPVFEAKSSESTSSESNFPETKAPEKNPPKPGLFARLKAGLQRTSSQFGETLGNLFLGKKTIDDELFEELETQLLVADVGVEATRAIIKNLTQRVSRKELADAPALYAALQAELKAIIAPAEKPLVIDAITFDKSKGPFVILMVGVNGVGKTTTIGKLAKRFQNEGKRVMLAAGDTFRAAAVEQLQVWGERNNVPVIAQGSGADSASVIFDALQAAKARGIDVLIADTAGRLQNKDHLMEELKKVLRVMAKIEPTAPHEIMLVLDAGTGQNALSQARTFRDAVGVTGLVLSKLDGTAKGGIMFAICQQLGLPVRFIGVGETADDLRPFVADDFIAAIFNHPSTGSGQE